MALTSVRVKSDIREAQQPLMSGVWALPPTSEIRISGGGKEEH